MVKLAPVDIWLSSFKLHPAKCLEPRSPWCPDWIRVFFFKVLPAERWWQWCSHQPGSQVQFANVLLTCSTKMRFLIGITLRGPKAKPVKPSDSWPVEISTGFFWLLQSTHLSWKEGIVTLIHKKTAGACWYIYIYIYFWNDFYSSLESFFCSNLCIKTKAYISIYVLVVVRIQKSSRYIVQVYSTWHDTQHTQHHTTSKNCQVNIPVTFYQSWSRRRTDTEAAGCYCWWRHAHCCALGAG